MRSWVVLLFTLCALVLVVVAKPARPRTITQACHGDLKAECPTRDVECLAKHRNEAKVNVCREWIDARAACLDFVRTHGCNEGNHRVCIRSTPKEELPPLCVESAYYASLYRYLPRRDL